jgi:WD40 repeat protein
MLRWLWTQDIDMFGSFAASPMLTPTGITTQYLALGHDTSPFLSIYIRNGDVLTKLADPAALPGSSGNGCAFSPNGDFLAVACSSTPYIAIYQRAGSVFTKLSNPATIPTGNGTGVAWSPNGLLLAVSHFTSPYITIYSVSGTTFTKIANPAALPPNDGGRGCAFSKDGTLFAVTHDGPTVTVSIYTVSGTTFTKQPNPATLPGALQPSFGCAFSPDGAYLAVASGSQSQSHTIYAITAGPTFTKIANPSMPSVAFEAAWTADSSVLLCGHVYNRSGSTFTNLTRPAGTGITSNIAGDITADGDYLAYAGFPSQFMSFYKKAGSTLTLLPNPATLPTGTGRGIAWSPQI